MAELKNVIYDIERCICHVPDACRDCSHYPDKNGGPIGCMEDLLSEALELLKEQDERLRKLQKDKDNLCLEISEWKHKFHDAPPKFVSQGVVDQIRWERDTALSQLEQIGKGLGSKMDDIVALLDKQDSEKKRILKIVWDTLHEGLSIDTVSDQDWVYERIRNRIEGTYSEV